jgi:hypothetical protein
MDTAQIIAELRSERDRLDQAIAALEGLAGAPGRAVATMPSVAKPAAGRRRISAAGRKRIAEAAKRRWAKVKAAHAAPSRHLSAGARKRLSELAKARWAKRKREGKTRL